MNLEELRLKVVQKKFPYLALYPIFWAVSEAFCLVADLRRRAYESGLLKRISFGYPVVGVGNVVAGGSGKTPITEFVYRVLEEAGFHTVAVLKGYGGKVKESEQVVSFDPKLYGDEAALMYKKGIKTVVSPKKWEGVSFAIDLGASAVVVDDAFQHLKLKPLINILVVDAFDPFGSSKCLPLGRLREPLNSVQSADCIVISRANLVSQARLSSIESFFLSFKKPIFRANFSYSAWLDRNFNETKAPDRDINVVCAIGNPHQFKKHLESLGFRVKKFLSFPDHYDYSQKDAERLRELDNLVVTEKDLVKLSRFSIDAKAPVLKAEVFGLKEFILNRINNAQRGEFDSEEEIFLHDGIHAPEGFHGRRV